MTNLRFVLRDGKRVLQQIEVSKSYQSASGQQKIHHIWKDVPLINEETGEPIGEL